MGAMTRVPTRVPGLDAILHGGLFGGGVYIVEGAPGVGKTTLANQMAYLHAQAGANTLYVTLLAESHARMLQHMERQTFFDAKAVNSSVFYISAYRESEQGGFKAVLDLLRGEIGRHHTSLVVVDGLVIPGTGDQSSDGVRQFVHELQSIASAMDCICLLLTGGKGALNPEQTMVDGILLLEDHAHQWRAERRIQVRKFRGSAVERGHHTFCITDDGLKFFPRLEGQAASELPTSIRAVVPSGIGGLDEALRPAGLFRGSSTLVSGASGTGKTTMALAFAAQADRDHPCLAILGLEAAGTLAASGQALGLPVAARVQQESLIVHPQAQEDESLDEVGHKILRLVEERQVARLVVDGLDHFTDTVAFPSRGYRFTGRLLHELKARGVTSLFTAEPSAVAITAGRPVVEALSGLFDNALDLEHERGRPDGYELVVRKIRGVRVPRARFHIEIGDSGPSVGPAP